MASFFSDTEIHLRDYLYVLRKRRGVIFLFSMMVIAAGIFHTISAKVLYRASAVILVERENPNIVDFKEVMAFDASSTEYYQTQYQMIKRRSLIRELIEKENLQEDPYLVAMREGGLRRILEKQPFLVERFGRFLTNPDLEDVFIRRMLSVDPVRSSRLVQVSVLHPDPVRAAEITNRLVELFIEKSLKDRFLISQQATELISGQLTELKEKVNQSERELQKYKEAHGLVNLPSLREKNEFMQEAKLELVKIQAEEARLAKRYLPAHPKMIHIHSQIEGVKQKIAEEEEKILEISRIAIDYGELEREAESSKQTYKSLLKRLQETTSEAQAQASNMMLVDRANPPPKPSKPQPLINLAIALVLGLGGGVLLAFFIEYLDSTIKIPDDIEKGLGLDLLGIIPRADKVGKLAKGELFFSPGQHSLASESFRALRTSLLFKLRRTPGCRKILITSPNPEEGKSTIALNLAAAFQQNHLRVLLIDADLRKPRLHHLFDLSASRGLSNVLEGEISTREAIYENVGETGIDFLSCGTPSHHPAEILGSSKMKEIMNSFEEKYDLIVMDGPPFLAVADVAVLSEYTDALLVVARYHKTDKRHLKNLKQRFSEVPLKVLGMVINQVSVREKDYYYHQYYYYGYGNAVQKK
ncbi:MAG: polysaccharide biosynthesis tyrosine autokinase [Candidatus Omnitrophica bacterium]|nr:polysaccharide biosynthesis tyrosine autokinase [Candidatus Omnitrophota bacterium]